MAFLFLQSPILKKKMRLVKVRVFFLFFLRFNRKFFYALSSKLYHNHFTRYIILQQWKK